MTNQLRSMSFVPLWRIVSFEILPHHLVFIMCTFIHIVVKSKILLNILQLNSIVNYYLYYHSLIIMNYKYLFFVFSLVKHKSIYLKFNTLEIILYIIHILLSGRCNFVGCLELELICGTSVMSVGEWKCICPCVIIGVIHLGPVEEDI